jgi:GNAT superfamily N-acetyltransferase
MDAVGEPSTRDAVPDDAPSIARIHVDAWRETYTGLVADDNFTESAVERRLRFWSGYLALDPRPGRMVVGGVGGGLSGFANAGLAAGPDAEHGNPPARELNLFSIYVLARDHGTGLGQLLLDAAIGDTPAQLWVLDGNDRANAFYRRNGFEFDGARAVDPTDPGLVDLRMVR